MVPDSPVRRFSRPVKMPKNSNHTHPIHNALVVLLLAVCMWGTMLISAPTVHALPSFEISELSYTECPDIERYEGLVTSWGGGEAKCIMIHGKANNQTGKPIINADVFGWIYDANGNSLMENRGRLGGIDEVPPGVSDFELRISVPAEQPLPLSFERFKGSGFTGKVRR